MPTKNKARECDPLEEAEGLKGTQAFVLKLFVTGSTPRSVLAIENILRICEVYLSGRYHLKVVDIYQQPEFARSEQIIAAPTLIKESPIPMRRLVGDLSDEKKVLVGLGLQHPPGG